MSTKIKVAIAGVGNCASSQVQRIHYYSVNSDVSSIFEMGEDRVSDIQIVTTFDIDERKVDKDLSQAIFVKPSRRGHTGMRISQKYA